MSWMPPGIVQALQPVLLAAVGIGHHEHRGVRGMGLEQVKEGGNHAHDVDPRLRVARRAVQQFDDGELVVRVGLLEVLRREVDVHVTGEVAPRTGDRGLEQVSDLGVFREAGDPADVLVELLVSAGPRGCVLGDAAHALVGEIIDHPAPGLVVVVELIDGGDSEDHGGNERQARGEHAEHDLLGQGHPDEQSPEDHHEKQEETGPLRFKHSVLLAGVWSYRWSPHRGQVAPPHNHVITTANVRGVTLSSPSKHAKRARGLAQRWRWDLNPRRGCPLTRFRGVRPRPLGDSTAGELTRIRACAAA